MEGRLVTANKRTEQGVLEPDVADDGKKTSRVIVWITPALELELHRLAQADDRKMSDYVGVVLRRHVFGHSAGAQAEPEDANRAYSPGDRR